MPSDLTPTLNKPLPSTLWLTFFNTGAAPFFTLKGYARNWQSPSITLLLKRQNPDGSPYLKPSRSLLHRADQQGCQSPPALPHRCRLSQRRMSHNHSLLGLSLQANGEVKEITKPDEPVDLSGFKVIICDEASMNNRFLMDAISETYAKWRSLPSSWAIRRSFRRLGDYFPVWKIPNGAELTTVMRYGNSMLDLTTTIRKVVDSFPSVEIETKPRFSPWARRLAQPNRSQSRSFLNPENKGYCTCNVTVNQHNAYIRG